MIAGEEDQGVLPLAGFLEYFHQSPKTLVYP